MIEFLIENIYILIVVAAGVAQWWKSTQDAKKERENADQFEPEYDYSEEALEEFLEDAERRSARPAVPPPLPAGQKQIEVKRSSPPVLQRSRRPAAKETWQDELETFSSTQDHTEELARQAALAERLSGLKEAKQARKAREAPVDIRSSGMKSKIKTPVGGLRGRLRSRQELRQAFVLKEILEKPVGLR
jgi:hypothetical protein